MLIIANGKSPDRKFTCTLPFDGPIGNPEEAIHLLISRKKLFREWIKGIILVQDDTVLRHWKRKKDWKK